MTTRTFWVRNTCRLYQKLNHSPLWHGWIWPNTSTHMLVVLPATTDSVFSLAGLIFYAWNCHRQPPRGEQWRKARQAMIWWTWIKIPTHHLGLVGKKNECIESPKWGTRRPRWFRWILGWCIMLRIFCIGMKVRGFGWWHVARCWKNLVYLVPVGMKMKW